MAEFLKGAQINSALEKIIRKAEKKLILISPYIKLHDTIKDLLLTHLENHKLLITVTFGKNEKNKSKSLNKSDFEFIKQFSNVQILYHPRLHAKFYQNDWNSLLTSMNLYDYSQDNNIEFGILTPASEGKAFKEKLDKDASNYFDEILDTSKVLFNKTPHFEKSLAGLKSKYTHSKIEVDKLTEVYEANVKTFTPNFKTEKQDSKIKLVSTTVLSKSMGMQSKELFELLDKNEWIYRKDNLWKLTSKGQQNGGLMKSFKKDGKNVDYIAWPESIINQIDVTK